MISYEFNKKKMAHPAPPTQQHPVEDSVYLYNYFCYKYIEI
ncbi:hypothetical protein M901_1686 [Bacteriovorax sp. DB6_IX]|nr:hypothetical protein M901_1686 [Bacteriovorax sp. DB6_IX]